MSSILFSILSLMLGISSYATEAPAPAAASSVCEDAGKVYKVCANQEELYEAAFSKAKAEKKKLLVVIGAEWCPWCLSLHRLLRDPAVFTEELSGKYSLVDIALYQKKEKLHSGVAVQQKLKKQAKYKPKLAGIPVMALVNPANGKAAIIDTEPLEKNTETSKGHDAAKVLAAIEKAALKVK